jgi:hypothetical protein
MILRALCLSLVAALAAAPAHARLDRATPAPQMRPGPDITFQPLPSGAELTQVLQTIFQRGFNDFVSITNDSGGIHTVRLRGNDLQTFQAILVEEPTALAPEDMVRQFENEFAGCTQQRTENRADGRGVVLVSFSSVCRSTGGNQAQLFFFATNDGRRSRLLSLFVPAAQGRALLARGNRLFEALLRDM